jgi:xylulokinase
MYAIGCYVGSHYDVEYPILWLREHCPQVYERAAGFLLPGSALVAWLTGERVVDHANASSTLLYDITAGDWSPRMLEVAGLDARRLGTIRAATDVVGRLRPPARTAYTANAVERGLIPKHYHVPGA